MSTAVATAPEQVDLVIAASVRALAHGQGRDIGVLASEVGMSRAALYQKLKCDRPFKAAEVAALARSFGVRVGDLYDGLGGRVGPGSASGLPHLDSNQEPAGNRWLELVGSVAEVPRQDRPPISTVIPRQTRAAGITRSSRPDVATAAA